MFNCMFELDKVIIKESLHYEQVTFQNFIDLLFRIQFPQIIT